MEVYNTIAHPYELYNLVNSTDPKIQRMNSRLNVVLLVTNSLHGNQLPGPLGLPVAQHHCILGDTLLNPQRSHEREVRYLVKFLPTVHCNECLQIQLLSNEVPFYPASLQFELGSKYRGSTDYYWITTHRGS